MKIKIDESLFNICGCGCLIRAEYGTSRCFKMSIKLSIMDIEKGGRTLYSKTAAGFKAVAAEPALS